MRIIFIISILFSATAFAADAPNPAQISGTAFEENQARFKDSKDHLVLPGLLADRKAGQVRVWARATGLAGAEACEFLLIAPGSGKDYEALAVSYAKAEDVHRALEFIGMAAGEPVNFSTYHSWPKGERVKITAHVGEKSLPAEQLFIDMRDQKPIPEAGFVFVGSIRLTPEGESEPKYAADLMDPRTIVSIYNEPTTVLDVPRRWAQGLVYGFMRPNPANTLEKDQSIQFTFEPEHRDPPLRVRDMQLIVKAPNDPKASLDEVVLVMIDGSQKKDVARGNVAEMLAAISETVQANRDPFVRVQIDPALSIENTKKLYSILMSVEGETGLRLLPPGPGEIYHEAFFPDEEWRDPSRRVGEPWEILLSVRDGKVRAGVKRFVEDEGGGRIEEMYRADSPEKLAALLADKSTQWSKTLFIVATPDLTYGQVRDFIRPSLATHPTVYVFTQPSAAQ